MAECSLYITSIIPAGSPVTSVIVAANRRLCSNTQLALAKPKCTQYSSKHLILLCFGKQTSMSHLVRTNDQLKHQIVKPKILHYLLVKFTRQNSRNYLWFDGCNSRWIWQFFRFHWTSMVVFKPKKIWITESCVFPDEWHMPLL